METLLEVKNLTKKFGGLVATNDISFSVYKDEILSVIGPNGAGKSTLFKLIASFLKPTSGSVQFKGEEMTSYPPHKVAQKGVVRTFQETTIFRDMTVLQNVAVAHQVRARANIFGVFWSSRTAREDEKAFINNSEKILENLGLHAIKDELAKNLPHGHLRALSVAVALAVDPQLLLLDEPFAGLNPEETKQAVEMVRRVRSQGITIMLVEHDMRAVMEISERILVLNFGEMIASGKPQEIKQNTAVIDAYLGKDGGET